MSLFLAALRKKAAGAAPSLRAALHTAAALLEKKAVDSPRLSAELILARTLGLDRNALLKELLLRPDAPLTSYQLQLAEALTARRLKGEPMAYILGKKEFYGREFSVTRDTLVPRPETELLVDLALKFAAAPTRLHGGVFADFGTGSGCIAITLALELTNWKGVALDNSPSAIDVACGNARRYRALNLACVQADFLFPPVAAASLDMLVSNPPYISEQEYLGLSLEVINFEPKSALVPLTEAALRQPVVSGPRVQERPRTKPPLSISGAQAAGKASSRTSPNRRRAADAQLVPPPQTRPATGIEDAERIIIRAQQLLRPGGILLMEMGCSQGAALVQRLDQRLVPHRLNALR